MLSAQKASVLVSEREEVGFSGQVWVWQARSGEKPVRWFFVSIEGSPPRISSCFRWV
jgi:hypothetical protein